MFSHRLPSHGETNALSRAVDALRGGACRSSISPNPIQPAPASRIRRAARAAGAPARACATSRTRSACRPRARPSPPITPARRDIDPDAIVLTASTSEAYSWLFKLLCDPGDCVLVPRPSYPLFEHLTRLEGVRVALTTSSITAAGKSTSTAWPRAPAATRAVLVVSPNNPTGSFVSAAELERLDRLCRDRGWALIVDEVFADYPLDVAGAADRHRRAPRRARRSRWAALSKSLGLPQVKLGWIVVGGPAAPACAALARAGTDCRYVSVGRHAGSGRGAGAADAGADVRRAIHERVRANLRHAARAVAASFRPARCCRVEGGWSAVMRVPATRARSSSCSISCERERILVHPGYFFDFTREAFCRQPAAATRDIRGGMAKVLRAVS